MSYLYAVIIAPVTGQVTEQALLPELMVSQPLLLATNTHVSTIKCLRTLTSSVPIASRGPGCKVPKTAAAADAADQVIPPRASPNT